MHFGVRWEGDSPECSTPGAAIFLGSTVLGSAVLGSACSIESSTMTAGLRKLETLPANGFIPKKWTNSCCCRKRTTQAPTLSPLTSDDERALLQGCTRVHIATSVEMIIDLCGRSDHPPIEENIESCSFEIFLCQDA